jgi:concentrative nucleoside transporter, CNT family
MQAESVNPAESLPSAQALLPQKPPTPWTWRVGIAMGVLALGIAAYLLRDTIGPRGQAFVGIFCFFGLVAMFSSNLRAVNWRTIGWGVVLQIILAVLVLKVAWVHDCLEVVKSVVNQFMDFSDKGSEFVFGNLAHPGDIALNPGAKFAFMFAFKVLPPILFVSAFFTMLYHYGILQRIVQVLAHVMVHLMGTSGAETLSVSANVFMGQTEAPLIVKPYVPRMTNSELFVLMASGMAHISGAMMVVYIGYGADAAAVLTTCIMACPCSLYLSKLFMPEVSIPETAGTVRRHKEKSPYVNGIDAITAGTTDGLKLALNVAAMLIVFIAFVAMFDAVLGHIKPGLAYLHIYLGSWADDLSLAKLFGWLFSPAAFLIGVEPKDVPHVASLLGAKLSINEHYAFLLMKSWKETPNFMTDRSYMLVAFALTGFANFSSVGIQLGGIGAIAPGRRQDLARLGLRALFVGFVATLLNAAIAGVFLQ